jgi:hypothetical protein
MIAWPDVVNVFALATFLLLISGIVFLLTYGITRIFYKLKSMRGTRQVLKGIWGGFPLGFTGMAAGFLTGSSRAPAVTALVPAILTFVGLSVVYLMGKGNLRALLAGLIVLIFSINLLIGTFLGTVSRDRAEQLSESLEVSKIRAEKEFALRQYRNALGLPAQPPRVALPAASSERP